MFEIGLSKIERKHNHHAAAAAAVYFSEFEIGDLQINTGTRRLDYLHCHGD